ncbi:Erythroid membrane-associated [Gossypium arboreum]|uniref:Erythroid membrane-associated n=1 Tax=Gossypium arboreum TaxID=29729 RepID=A0A0B0PMK1_GOSAR|nr:Erythroid membrane-associated [Gossypium arboreum]
MICSTCQVTYLPYFKYVISYHIPDHFSSFYTFNHNLSLPVEPFRIE